MIRPIHDSPAHQLLINSFSLDVSLNSSKHTQFLISHFSLKVDFDWQIGRSRLQVPLIRGSLIPYPSPRGLVSEFQQVSDADWSKATLAKNQNWQWLPSSGSRYLSRSSWKTWRKSQQASVLYQKTAFLRWSKSQGVGLRGKKYGWDGKSDGTKEDGEYRVACISPSQTTVPETLDSSQLPRPQDWPIQNGILPSWRRSL